METFLRLMRVGGNGRLLIVTDTTEDTLSPIVAGYSAVGVKYDTVPKDSIASLWDDKIYDTIILPYIMCGYRNKAMNEVKLLKLLTRHLDRDGRIYVLENNRINGGEGFVRQELLRAIEEASLFATFFYPYPEETKMDYVFSDLRGPRGDIMEAAVAEGIFPSLAPKFLVCIKKNDTPEHLIFKRYGNDRTDGFAVATGVHRTPKGARFVVREPINEKAVGHVATIYDHYLRLAELYKGYTLQIAACDKVEGNNIVRVEYMDGVTLKMLLERTLAKDDYETFYNLFRRMTDIITSPARIMNDRVNMVHFSGNRDFINYFGTINAEEEQILAGEMVLPITNVNGLLKGIWVKERTWIMADYEWVVDFAVPFGYVVYREIDEFFEDKPGRNNLRDELLMKYQITPEKIAIFSRMKIHFNRYVYKSTDDESFVSGGSKSTNKKTTKKGRFPWSTK